ncbi:ABC transporter permease [Azospirillum sp.]|uniref:ABC transporter permease n=1 Tax=Azospirillum sp. TaxID=34012 RepID=UPI002D560DF8|nr:ABC transporter permease subunit [Azospirillum sp.]HYD67967.1 ABC transporter permease subunit [Azospirillum sp.]
MTRFLAILRKELAEYFSTPIAYAVLIVFWVVSGYFFSFNLFFVNAMNMVTAFHNMSVLLILVTPLITMRVFSEEAKTGTLELLLTLPLSDTQIVLGKFLASLLVMVLMLAGTATAVVPLLLFGEPDLGPILGGYLGVTLLGTAFLAIGVLVSSLSQNQIVAALVTWAVIVLLWFVDYAASLNLDYTLTRLLNHLSFSVHYVDLIRGVLNGTTVVYFASVIAAALVLTVQSLRRRHA